MARHHLIISGTGRAGTTFLVQLMTELRLDTGFATSTSGIHSNCNAGMERDIREQDAPYVVKSPWLCDYLDQVLQSGEVVIDHAIVPVRDLYPAAESRRDVVRRSGLTSSPDEIPGGLWHTKNPDDQEVVLLQQLYKLIYAIAKHGIPMMLLHFPRLVREPAYLYEKIGSLLPGIDYDSFRRAFQAVSRPELVHDFLSDGKMRTANRGVEVEGRCL